MSARSLNKVLLIGNLTRDPEVRYTPSGTAVCTFGLATNRSWVPADGSDRQEETEYHRIVAWAKLAEICSQLLYKGRKIYVEGRMQTRKFTTQEGYEREITEVVIDNMIALGDPKNGKSNNREEYDYEYQSQSDATPQSGSSTSSTNQSSTPAASDSQTNKTTDTVDVDDIPF